MNAPIPDVALRELLERAQAARLRGQWRAAAAIYRLAGADGRAAQAPALAYLVSHHLALCHFALGEHDAALAACQVAARHSPYGWQTAVLEARILRACGQAQAAAEALARVLDQGAPAARLEMAALQINEFGSPRAALDAVRPLLGEPAHRAEAQLTAWLAKLYDRDETDEALSARLMAFARSELSMASPVSPADAAYSHGGASNRLRVGLISPLFRVSPVHFLTYGALSRLTDDVDLVVFDRGQGADWATGQWRAIAREWHGVAHLGADALARSLRAQALDVLIDLGGWMDPQALRALSCKPARRMYKWVGGQSATTGLSAFDGWLGDAHQTPGALQHLYAEPIVQLKAGYVTYTPPPYMPVPPAAGAEYYDYAILGNPAKISRDLVERVLRASAIRGGVLALIDRRYAHPHAQAVVERLRALRPKFSDIVTIVPSGHADYLAQVARVRHVIDTFPYNGGLTSLEAIWLRRSILSAHGKLFSARHTLSHLRYSDYRRAEAVSGFERFVPAGPVPDPHCARLRHGDLAAELLTLFSAPAGRKAA